ncbi:MAG: LytR C-terminal domain-containing protein [Myxococcaceae bacterium]
MKTISVAAMLFASLAMAEPYPEWVDELRGVTADGRYLVWVGKASDGETALTYQVVEDMMLGSHIAYRQADPGDLLDSLTPQEAPHGPAAFRKWLAAHPIKPLIVDRSSPDHKRVADVEVKAGTGSWAGDSFSSDGTVGCSLLVRHDGTADEVGFSGSGDAVSVAWSPDGKHTIWVVHRRGRSIRDEPSDELVIGTDGSPAVAVLAPRAKMGPAKDVAEKLAKAGFEVGSLAPMMKPRDKSVVFGAKNQLELAKKVAAAVPGGATVEALTWHTPFDVVVALGPDALK